MEIHILADGTNYKLDSFTNRKIETVHNEFGIFYYLRLGYIGIIYSCLDSPYSLGQGRVICSHPSWFIIDYYQNFGNDNNIPISWHSPLSYSDGLLRCDISDLKFYSYNSNVYKGYSIHVVVLK